jgi:predicted porin
MRFPCSQRRVARAGLCAVKSFRAFLLASAALPALATIADAAERSASVGGYFHGYLAGGEHDDGPGEPNFNTRDHWLAREAEIHFDGSIKLDNGLGVGVRVELEAETCADQIDETYVFFDGGFGRVMLGSTNGAPYKMAVTPRSALPGHGFSDPRFLHAQNGTNSVGRSGPVLQNLTTSDSEKLIYFTPRIAGLQVGASYMPDRCEEAGCGGQGSGPEADNNLDQQSEAFELGVNYTRKFGEVGLAVSAGWTGADNENPSAGMTDQEEWSTGASLAWAGFTFAVAYHQDNRGISGRGDRDDWGGSLHYAAGPWSFSLGGVRSTVEEPGGGEDVQKFLEAGASYALGPGVVGSVGLQNFVFEDDLGAPGAENRALYVLTGLTLTF